MKRRFLSTMIVILALAVPAFATPTAVTLYPHGATITEQTSIAAGSKTITLLLPNVAQPKSLRLALLDDPKQKIVAIEFESLTPDTTQFSDLAEKISQLEQKIAAIDDQLESNKLAIDYWKNQQNVPIKTLADAQEMAKIIRKESRSLLKDSTQQEQQKGELNQQLKEAQRELQQKIGTSKRNWQATVRLSHPTATTSKLKYSYRVNHAGWASNYILNAHPEQKQVDWLWTAKIMQQTGVDWKGVQLKVATTEPVFTLTPPVLRSWNVNAETFYDGREERVMAMAMPEMQLKAAPASAMRPNKNFMPKREEGQLFDVYDLGRVDIASGKESRMTLREGQWNANFVYLCRPLLSEQVFLEATLDFTEGFIPLPTGTASIQVDGIHVGQRNFFLHKRHNVRMSFGSDPGINVDVKTDHIAGEQGILSKKNTYNWNWTISFTNNKQAPINLRVEDSEPHVGHKKIEMEEHLSDPAPKKEDGKLVWELKIPAHETEQIKYGYSIKYPEDLDVSLGR